MGLLESEKDNEWELVGTITKTWNGSNASSASVTFPADAKEIFISVDLSKTSSSLTWNGTTFVEKPFIDKTDYFISVGTYKQSGFGIMVNRYGTSRTVTMWAIYDASGTGFADGSTCEAKVYYR